MTKISNTILWVEDKRPSIRGFVDKIDQECPKVEHEFSTSLEDAMTKINQAAGLKTLYKVVFIDLHFENFPPELDTLAKQKKIIPDFNEGQFFALWLEQKLPNQDFHFITGLSGAFNPSITYTNDSCEILDKNIILPFELASKLSSLKATENKK